METHAFGFRLPANAPEGQKRFPISDADRLFYFDPDIVMKARWAFFEEWAGYGAALVEDVNSPMPESHQRRCAWRQCLTQRQQAVQRETPFYVNGGFVV